MITFDNVDWYEGFPGWAVEDIVARDNEVHYGSSFRTAIFRDINNPPLRMEGWSLVQYYYYPDGTLECVYEQ